MTGGNQTWTYDGSTWLQVLTPTTPPGLETPAMAYDAARRRTILFGGNGTFGGWYNDTWAFDGTNWTQIRTATAPGDRYEHAMAQQLLRR